MSQDSSDLDILDYQLSFISVRSVMLSTSVDTANLAALGLPFVICLSTIRVYIPLFVMNKRNNSLKLSIATV